MKTRVLSLIAMAALGACGVAESETPEIIAEASQAASENAIKAPGPWPVDVFYENFNNLNPGIINGQNGWTGDCMVVAGPSAGDKNLDCTGGAGLQNGRGAMHSFYRPPGRNYHFQFDAWQTGVVDATHGKVFLENPPGDGSHAIIQFAIGCTGVRATFEYHGNTSRTLLSSPTCRNGVRYRVACYWQDGGTEYRCGASDTWEDPNPANFISIPALGNNGEQEYIGPFDRVRLLGGIGERVGTTTFDKVQVLAN